MVEANGGGKIAGADDVIPKRAYYATYAIGFFGNGMTLLLKVVFPLWAIHLGMSASMIGFAIGIGALLPFLLSIHSGVLMDRLGTRRVTLVFAITTMVATPLYPAMPWVAAVIFLQLITGLTTNMVWVGAQSLICQYTQGTTSMIGRFSFCARVGTLTTPILIGAVWDFAGHWGAFVFGGVWAGMVCLALLAVPLVKNLPEAEAVKVRVSQRDLTPRISDYLQAFSLVAIPAVAFIVATTVLRISSSGIQTSFYVVYLNQIGLTGTFIGTLISISEGVGCFGTLAAGPVERFIKPHWVMLLFVALSLTFVTITPLLGGIFGLLALATAMRGFAQGLTQPVMFGILARAVTVKQQGISIGLRTTANRLASILVPVAMGIVADAVGIEASFLIIGGTLIALCGVAALVVRRIPGLQT